MFPKNFIIIYSLDNYTKKGIGAHDRGSQIPLWLSKELWRDTPGRPLINPYIEQLFRSHLSAGFCGFVTGKGSKNLQVRRRYASWRENVISIWFRFMICEALTILIYHTEGSSPIGAVLRQGRGPEVCGRVGILSDQKFPSSPSRLLNPWKRHLHKDCTGIFFVRSWTSRVWF